MLKGACPVYNTSKFKQGPQAKKIRHCVELNNCELLVSKGCHNVHIMVICPNALLLSKASD